MSTKPQYQHSPKKQYQHAPGTPKRGEAEKQTAETKFNLAHHADRAIQLRAAGVDERKIAQFSVTHYADLDIDTKAKLSKAFKK